MQWGVRSVNAEGNTSIARGDVGLQEDVRDWQMVVGAVESVSDFIRGGNNVQEWSLEPKRTFGDRVWDAVEWIGNQTVGKLVDWILGPEDAHHNQFDLQPQDLENQGR